MTTIIGVQYADRSVLLADNQITDAEGKIFSHPDVVKISQVGTFLVAGAGEVQPCDTVQHTWVPPKPTAKDKENLYHFMIAKAMPSLRQCLKDNGYNFEEAKEAGSGPRFQFLMSVCGELFEVDDNLGLTRSGNGFYGVGSGAPYALGALEVGAKPMKAMAAAAKLTAFTSGPYQEMVQYK